MSMSDREYLVKALLVARLARDNIGGAVADWNRFGGSIAGSLETDLVLRLLVTNAVESLEASAGAHHDG